GAIRLDIDAGESPFFIDWTGPVDGSVNLAAYEYVVDDLPAGTYTFSLTNNDGCEDTQTITLNNDGNLELVASVVPDDCGVPYQIWVDIEGGTGPYDVDVTQVCNGVATPANVELSGAGFEVVDVEPCCYILTVTDANGCTTTQEVCVDPSNLFNIIPENGICGQPGSVEIMVMNSTAVGPYTINFTGPITGVTTDGDGALTLPGLPAGNYTFTVTDANGCQETEDVSIEDIPSDLTLATALINNECGQYNQLWNDVFGGVMPYTVALTRLCDGVLDTTFTISSNEFELFDLDECCYEVKVTDAQGCMVTTETCVEAGDPDLFSITPVPGPWGPKGPPERSLDPGPGPDTQTEKGAP
ncbi:MAG: carboxypeptidase-like regulatory domain-containing protein, partial [Bacteroidota bacterium]